MGRRVKVTVVLHPKEGEPVWLQPGDEAPDWADITNPEVWADEDEPAQPDATAADGDSEVVDGPFDPSQHTVPDVMAYLEGLGDEQADEYSRVIDAESAGQARKGILGA